MTKAAVAEPVRNAEPSPLEDFERAAALWAEYREPGVLGDILSFSVHPELLQRVIDIGNQAVRQGAPITSAQRFILKHLAHANGSGDGLVLAEPGDVVADQLLPFAKPIRDLRALLRTAPSNALALLDFAQLQTAIGATDVAEKALRTALGLAPKNRLVLRTLARFYVHAGKADRAHALVRRHDLTANDPWLIASEIALADLANVPSAFLLKGRRMLTEAGKTPPASFTELAGSIAMEELTAGSLKKARELQRIALLAPTDNVAAQAVDQQMQFGIALNAANVERAIESSSEARMLRSWFSLDPFLAEECALQWHNEEPFSSRPIQILTAMFAYQDDLKRAMNWLTVGLRSDPSDRGLLVNLAYVQARAGLLDQARLTILKTRRLHTASVEPYLIATEGLIAYQHQRYEEGDQLYGRAIELFDASDKVGLNQSTFCLLNQAIAALDLKHPRADEILKRAGHVLHERPSPNAVMLLKVAGAAGNQRIPDAEPMPVKRTDQRLTSQWVFDPSSNTLTERKGLTAPGAKPILLLEDQSSRPGQLVTPGATRRRPDRA